MLIAALLHLFVQYSFSQFLSTETDSRASSMGGANVALSDRSTAVFSNPSGLAQLKQRHISFYLEPVFYGLDGISTAALTLAEPFGFGTIGIGLRTFGFELYRETKMSLSCGVELNENIYAGAGLGIYNVSVSGYGSAFSAGADIGVVYRLSGDITWGFSALNLTGSTIGSSKQSITRLYRTGIAYMPEDNVVFLLDAEKDPGNSMNVRFGGEVRPVEPVYLRAGISSYPVSYSAGIGLEYGIISIDYAACVTEPLGLTNRFNLSFDFR